METEKKSHGALIGSIIIIVIILIGGIYIWQSKMKTALKEKNNQEEVLNSKTIEVSEELDELEQEINEINTNVNVDLDTIE